MKNKFSYAYIIISYISIFVKFTQKGYIASNMPQMRQSAIIVILHWYNRLVHRFIPPLLRPFLHRNGGNVQKDFYTVH